MFCLPSNIRTIEKVFCNIKVTFNLVVFHCMIEIRAQKLQVCKLTEHGWKAGQSVFMQVQGFQPGQAPQFRGQSLQPVVTQVQGFQPRDKRPSSGGRASSRL